MRGVFVSNQIEYRVEVTGEEFCQGDILPCSLTARNHAASPQTIAGLRLELACGSMKKIKDKAPDAFKVLAQAPDSGPAEIAPGQQVAVSCEFPLDTNCIISEKTQSLHLLYGSREASASPGQALLTILSHRHTRQILSILESSLQFIPKGIKSAEDWLQARFKPPTERRLSFLEELTLCFHFEGDVLLLKYLFKVKAFEASALSVGVKKVKSELAQRLERKDYLLTEEAVNHPYIETRIEEALTTVSTGL